MFRLDLLRPLRWPLLDFNVLINTIFMYSNPITFILPKWPCMASFTCSLIMIEMQLSSLMLRTVHSASFHRNRSFIKFQCTDSHLHSLLWTGSRQGQRERGLSPPPHTHHTHTYICIPVFFFFPETLSFGVVDVKIFVEWAVTLRDLCGNWPGFSRVLGGVAVLSGHSRNNFDSYGYTPCLISFNSIIKFMAIVTVFRKPPFYPSFFPVQKAIPPYKTLDIYSGHFTELLWR